MITFPHGETNVTLACQNKCVSCNHFIPVQKPWFCDPDVVRRDLDMAKEVMHFVVYNLVGGEPTLHPDLMKLIGIIRDSGITDTVEITSNGQAYKRWPDEMYQEIDDLIITPYKLDRSDLDYIENKCARYGTYFQIHPVIFTWAAYKQPHSYDRAHSLYRNCWYNVNRHVIDNGYFYRCCTSPFIPSVLLGMPKETDGLALDGITEIALARYMDQIETPKSCSVCAGNMGGQIPWRETTPDKWIEESIG